MEDLLLLTVAKSEKYKLWHSTLTENGCLVSLQCLYKRTPIISSDTLQHFSYLIPAASTGDGEGEDLGVHLKLLSLLENPAVIVAAAASGDIPTLKDYLSKHPRDVCKKKSLDMQNAL